MKLLVDTQAFLWWHEGSRRLGARARRAIGKQAAIVHLSTASAWEIAIKARTGRFTMRRPLHDWMPRAIDEGGFVALRVTLDHAMAVADLPLHHADPFDRLLIAQAQIEQLTIVTSDAAFDAYDVEVLDARD